MDQRSALSRRRLLQASAAGVAATIPVIEAAKATGARAPRPMPGRAAMQEGEIRLLIREDIKSAYAADAAVEEWNSQFPTKVMLDVPPTGLDISQRIQAAQVGGDLIWDGFAVIEVPWDLAEWVSRDIIQPMDDYIAASTVPGADQVIPGIIESIRESVRYEDQIYAIPGNVGSVSLAWLTEPLAEAGITTEPVSWQEVHDAAAAIAGVRPDFMPFDSATSPLCDLWAMIWGATDTPLNDEGLVDITGEASLAAIEWLRGMIAEGLMPPTRSAAGATNENWANWQRGATAIITSFDVAGTIAQQNFGKEAAVTGLNMRQNRDEVRAGTPFWTNCCVVLNGAKNPQAMTDFFLWWFGPENERTGRQITEVAAKPCYQYTYDQFVVDNPDYQWELNAIEVVRDSVQFPPGTSSRLQQQLTQPWLERAIGPEQMDPAEAMNSALEEIREEIAKQLDA